MRGTSRVAYCLFLWTHHLPGREDSTPPDILPLIGLDLLQVCRVFEDPNVQLSDIVIYLFGINGLIGCGFSSIVPPTKNDERSACFLHLRRRECLRPAFNLDRCSVGDGRAEGLISIFVSLFTRSRSTTRSLALNAIAEGRRVRWNTEAAKKASDGRRFVFCFLQTVSV